MAAKRYRERECRFCGRMFWPKSPSSKTCSEECRRADRTAAKKKLVIARREELAGPANRPLSHEEELAHEALLEATTVNGEKLSSADKVRLRMRDPLTKRTDITVGMVHPLDVLPDGRHSLHTKAKGKVELQPWVVS